MSYWITLYLVLAAASSRLISLRITGILSSFKCCFRRLFEHWHLSFPNYKVCEEQVLPGTRAAQAGHAMPCTYSFVFSMSKCSNQPCLIFHPFRTITCSTIFFLNPIYYIHVFLTCFSLYVIILKYQNIL